MKDPNLYLQHRCDGPKLGSWHHDGKMMILGTTTGRFVSIHSADILEVVFKDVNGNTVFSTGPYHAG